jgi:hypothetical protein
MIPDAQGVDVELGEAIRFLNNPTVVAAPAVSTPAATDVPAS